MNLVIEGDEHSIWAYLTDEETNDVVLDGFICSLGTIVESTSEVKAYIDSGFAPPISKQFSNEYTIQSDIKVSDIKVNWTSKNVLVAINHVEFLRMNWLTKVSYCRGVSSSGPYGQPLNS